MLAARKTPRIPEEYQEVAYLESTGTQLIDMGLYASYELQAISSIQCTDASAPNMFFGGRDSSTGTSDKSFTVGVSTDGYFYGQFGDSLNVIHIIRGDQNSHVFSLSKNGFFIDGAKYRDFGQDAFVGTKKLLAFAGTNGSTITYSRCRIRFLLLLQNGIKVRNFIPCYRKSDRKPGMYDLVTKRFFANQGTGEFIVGADVN